MPKVYGEKFIGEKFVSHIWDGGHFAKNALRTKDGRRLKVIYKGQWNEDSGADFRNAEIRINGQVQKGDVEVHVKGSHWRVHHHDVNPIYNNTILHVTMWDDSISLLTRKQNGERIPTLILYDYLDNSIGKLWKTIEADAEDLRPCCAKAETMTREAIGMILDGAGVDRFFLKTKVFERRLEENNEDQLLYEGIMEALGYSKNKKPFFELARRVPLRILAGQPPEKVQAVLFGVAGLLPSQAETRGGVPMQTELDEETEKYINRIETCWKPFLPQFEDRLMSREQWRFFRIRPGNLPTKRIAGMSYILSNCGNVGENLSASLLAMFLPAFSRGDLHKPGKTSQRLREILTPRASGYWTRHYTFGGKRHKENSLLVGRSRAADMVINVVLPMVFIHARQSRDESLQQAVMELYADYEKLQDNKITRYVAGQIFRDKRERNFMVDSSMRQQGLIHLYKSFCSAQNCQNCPLIKEVI